MQVITRDQLTFDMLISVLRWKMSNILIVGKPKTGKTTLTQMLKTYTHDDIRDDNFPLGKLPELVNTSNKISSYRTILAVTLSKSDKLDLVLSDLDELLKNWLVINLD